MGQRFNPPPGWPALRRVSCHHRAGSPTLPGRPAPPGWPFWLPDDSLPDKPVPAGPPGTGDTLPGPPPMAGQGQGASGSPGAPTPYPGQAAYGAPYGPPPYSWPPARGKVSGFAIAGFVLGLLGFLILTAILGVVFGLVALVKIRDNPQLRGKGLAIAGLAVSGLWLVLLVIGIVATAVSPPAPQRSGTGQVTRPGTTDVSSLRTGDCFQYPGARIVITQVTVVPCTQAHNAQVYAEFPAAGSSYPGPAALHRQSAAGCRAARGRRQRVADHQHHDGSIPVPGTGVMGGRRTHHQMPDRGFVGGSDHIRAGYAPSRLTGRSVPTAGARTGIPAAARRCRRGARQPRSRPVRCYPPEWHPRSRHAGRRCDRCCAEAPGWR